MYVCSKKLGSSSSNVFTISESNSKIVDDINFDTFKNATETVAAKDKDKLKEVVDKMKKNNL